ncbi:MAG TPA: serine/threonine-protein kinase [Ktedonobacteraceae bacterium]|jgi:serine/threonine protein kinase
MSPETLIGREIGKSVLQRFQGQGTLAAVYLASRAGRQVALKVFLPASALEQAEHEEFSQRLEEVIAQATSLDHPSILAVLDYGRHSGLTYLVTPYIEHESLQTRLKHAGALPLAQIQRYLAQLAAALDYAHARGVLHRDIKPANIFLTPGENVLLSDFGLAGLTLEKNFARVRRTAPGMLDTIAPEYVLGQAIGPRADLYALGAVLYQMVTGMPLFQGHTLAEVAVQHVRARPPSPCSLRPDLPRSAGEVMLRALAKQPEERYASVLDLASAFQLALEAALPDLPRATGSALDILADLAGGPTTSGRTAIPRTGGLFDPKWQTSTLPAAGDGSLAIDAQTTAAQPALSGPLTSPRDSSSPFGSLAPSGQGTCSGLLHLAPQQLQTASADLTSAQTRAPAGNSHVLDLLPAQPLPTPAGPFRAFAGAPDDMSHGQTPLSIVTDPVQVARPPAYATSQQETRPGRRISWFKIAGLLALVLLTAAASSVFLLTRNQSHAPSRVQTQAPPPSAGQRATATANAYVILSDALSQNLHNWPVGSQGWYTCAFADGAYHIINNDKNRSAPALLPGQAINSPFTYSLTMQQIKGDETVLNNLFGMILDASIQSVQGRQLDRFYAFEILNKAGGQYQFWKYDNSKSGNPWKSLWTRNFGKEFLQGSGPAHSNTVKIIATGAAFTFVVNGTQVGTLKDNALTGGSLGMLVNLNGAEVAFSHFLVTRV